ncbi:MAG: radical SAM protein, partial [Deltaproteobacteria bacterium]|nr:radical SAM protein [Deltaproteobacteria bacterium]
MPIDYLILILTTRCNLKCSYCYNGDLAPQDMGLKTLVRGLALAAAGEGPLRIQLTGGEPTLLPELIEAAAQEAAKLRRPYRLSLQTNATLLDRQLAKTLKKLNVEVGVSLDGPPALNEAMRGESKMAFRGFSALESEAWPFTATTVVAGPNAKELYQVPLVLAQYNAALGLGLDLLVQKGRGAEGPGSAQGQGPAKGLDAESLAAGLVKLKQTLAFINVRRKKPLILREEEFLRRARRRDDGQGFCAACRGSSLAVAPDGRVYPCGQSAFLDDFCLGTVFSEKLAP